MGASIPGVSHPFSLAAGALLTLCIAGCAHGVRATRLEELRTAADLFHQRIRWRDFRGAAEMVAPERRLAFERARKTQHDDRDLSITDYEIENIHLSADSSSATVTSRLSWTHLPSLSEHSELVNSQFALRDGSWFLCAQDGGPFAEELRASSPNATAGAN
jgi:hypothetical protein